MQAFSAGTVQAGKMVLTNSQIPAGAYPVAAGDTERFGRAGQFSRRNVADDFL